MGSLLVVTGPPGAGKSTIARLVADRLDPSALVEGDAFFSFVRTGFVPPWLPESRHQNAVVTNAAGAAVGRFVAGGFHVVYDGIVGPWFLPTFRDATGVVALDYVVLLPPLDVCLHRVATREGHGFRDEAATRKMHDEFTAAVVGLAVRHVLRGSDVVAEDILLAARRGELRYDAAG